MYKLPELSEIFDNINIGIHILDREGNYIYCNRAFLKMVGDTREEVLSDNIFRRREQGRLNKSVVFKAFEQKKKLSMIYTTSTPGGYQYRQFATATPLFDGEGEIAYMVVEMVRMDLFNRRYQQALMQEYDEREVQPPSDPTTIVTKSPAMARLLSAAEQVSGVDAAVLITGETGTGKEVLAHFIHDRSPRAGKAMVEINCAALPESLLEAELFGYEKGAFTGALNTGKPGLVEQAQGGTLFLDEINSLPLALQGKLLRVLETHKNKRLGAVREREIDFRLLTATNQDLMAEVEAGRFRADLFYRLNVIPLEVPPLRERREDIAPLALLFLEHYCKEYDREKALTKELLERMTHYDWPGNVRELKNAMERLVVTSAVGSVEINQLPGGILGSEAHRETFLPETSYPADWEYAWRSDPEGFSLKGYMEFVERKVLSDVLQQCGSSYKAAALLKTDQSTIVRKRRKYGL